MMLSYRAMLLAMTCLMTSVAHAQVPKLFSAPNTITPAADAEIALEPDQFSRGVILSLNTDPLLSTDEPVNMELDALDLEARLARLSPLSPVSKDSRSWYGMFDGGSITLVLRTGADLVGNKLARSQIAAGTIRTDDGTVYQIRHLAGDQVVVREQDPDLLPPESEAIVPDEEMVPVVKDGAEADGPFEFTVAVFYTKKARDAEGGTSKIKALIDLAVSETNVAYSESKVNAKLKLVYKGLTDDDESGSFKGMLKALQATSDGRMDEVHTTRNTYKA